MSDSDAGPELELVDLEPRVATDGGRFRRQRVAVANQGGRRRGRGRALVVLIVLCGLAWTAVAYRQLVAVRSDVSEGRVQLEEALRAAADGDAAAATASLEAASTVLASVPARVSAPVLAPARVLPGVAGDLDAVAVLADGVAEVVDAAVDVGAVLTSGNGSLGALTPVEGRVPLEAFATLAAQLEDLRTAAQRTRERVVALPGSGLSDELLEARAEVLSKLTPLLSGLDDAVDALALMPPMLGAEDERRYLVVASNPTESRGSGGFFGAFTIMTAADGALSFSDVRPVQDLPTLGAGIIPWPDPSLEERYERYGGTGFPLNLNMTPDFPSAATAFEAYYAEVTGAVVDGVIAVDPFAFEALLRISGPVDVPGIGTVGPDEVVEFVAHDAYAVLTESEERKRLIGLVATAALRGLLDGPQDVAPAQVVAALGEAVRRESILVHAVDPDEQAVLADLGVTGPLGDAAAGDYIGVFLNSGASYKIDYWLARRIGVDVVLGADGVAASTVSTGFTNGAPTSGEPDYMIGRGFAPLDIGDVLSLISVYCPPECTIVDSPDSGFADLPTEVGDELGWSVSSTWMRLASGQSQELSWTTTTADAWTQQGEDLVYQLQYGNQPTIIPVDLVVRVEVPDGYVATAMPEGASVVDGRVALEQETVQDVALRYVFSPVDRS